MEFLPEETTTTPHWQKPTRMVNYARMVRRLRNWPVYWGMRWFNIENPVFETRCGRVRFSVSRKLYWIFREIVLHDMYELTRFAGSIGNSPVILDIGANFGYFSLYAMALLPGATVYAYEPLSGNFAVLQRNRVLNLALVEKFHVFEIAVVGRERESVEFYVESDLPTSFSASVFEQRLNVQKTCIRVAATTLAQILATNGIGTVDLLKLDCEGAEYGILFDTPPAVLNRVKRIVMETHAVAGITSGHADMLKFLHAQGYATREMTIREGDASLIWAERRDSDALNGAVRQNSA